MEHKSNTIWYVMIYFKVLRTFPYFPCKYSIVKHYAYILYR